MKRMIDFERVLGIVEKIKEECLVAVDESKPMLSFIRVNNEGTNHGVFMMYYRILTELYKADSERLEAVAQEREASV